MKGDTTDPQAKRKKILKITFLAAEWQTDEKTELYLTRSENRNCGRRCTRGRITDGGGNSENVSGKKKL